MVLRLDTVAIDCRDPERLAAFWSEALGYRILSSEEGGVSIGSGDGSGPGLDFLVVPDDKVVKNRLHLDLRPDDREYEVERLLALGASRADVGQEDDASWVVLADPEGNEFCVLRAEGGG